MLSIRDCEILREAYAPASELTVDEALRQIGNPSTASLIAYACDQMINPDRNVRVLMLRLLARQTGAQAAEGVLLGLRDRQRRVCAAAIQACPNYMHREEVVRQLASITIDSSRKRKLCRRALSMLAGDEGRWRGDLTGPVFAALSSLIPEKELRFNILFGLVRLETGPRIERLLTRFVVSADETERLLAKRALEGERVIHIDSYSHEPKRRRQIIEHCDIAHGRMFYWIRRGRMDLGQPD